MLPDSLNNNLSLSLVKNCNFSGRNFDGRSSPMVYIAATVAGYCQSNLPVQVQNVL